MSVWESDTCKQIHLRHSQYHELCLLSNKFPILLKVCHATVRQMFQKITCQTLSVFHWLHETIGITHLGKHLQCKIANLSYSEGINQSTCAYIPTYINIHVYIHCVYAFLAWTTYRRNIFFFNEMTIWLWEKPLPTPYLSTENHFVLPGWHNSVSLRASLFCRSDKYWICQVTKSLTLT